MKCLECENGYILDNNECKVQTNIPKCSVYS